MPAPTQTRAAGLVVVLGGLLSVATAAAIVLAVRADETNFVIVDADSAGTPTSVAAPAHELVELVELESPTAVAARPGSGDLYILQLEGQVVRLDATDAAEAPFAAEPVEVLDISENVSTDQGGLVGITFDPAGEVAYLAYTDLAHDLVVEAHAVRARGALGPGRETIVVDRPDGRIQNNHIGGGVAFGPDGFLYIGTGDGGGAFLRAPDPDSLLGKVLRVDPRPSGGYDIPEGNPFDGTTGLEEVWTVGLRNPFRIAFDPGNGDLWVSDVGEESLEELNRLPAGEGGGFGVNLGWPQFAGSRPYVDEPSPYLVDPSPPSYEYDHKDGLCGVIGGVVYRNGPLGDIEGEYLFSDICSKALFGVRSAADGTLEHHTVALADETAMVSVDQDEAGHVFVTSTAGVVYLLR